MTDCGTWVPPGLSRKIRSPRATAGKRARSAATASGVSMSVYSLLDRAAPNPVSEDVHGAGGQEGDGRERDGGLDHDEQLGPAGEDGRVRGGERSAVVE